MALISGSRLDPYEIVSPLGAGGMGKVSRALATTLKQSGWPQTCPGAVKPISVRR
jgi:hypothetical protein